MRRTLIYSSYLDINKLDKFIHLIPDDIQIYIYEKNDEITDISNVPKSMINKWNNNSNIIHYHIPVIGEQHYAFILHIINNYDNLEGIIHFTKTHWTTVFSNISDFNQELNNSDDIIYGQHNTDMRKFVCILPDVQYMGYKHAIVDLLKKNNISIDFQDIISYNTNCFECNNNLKCYKCGLFHIPSSSKFKHLIFSTSYMSENSKCMKKLKEIFNDYNPVTEFVPRVMEASYIINSKILLFHNIDVYKNIINDLEKKLLGCHDEIGNFFDLFFKETLRRFTAGDIKS